MREPDPVAAPPPPPPPPGTPYRLPDAVREQRDPARLLRGIHLHQRGDFAGAGAIYIAVAREDADAGVAPNPAVRYLLGILAHQVNAHADAQAHLEAAVAAQPTWVEALYNLGVIHMHRGAWAAAEDVLRQAVALAPEVGPAWTNLGNLELGKGDVVAAEACFDRAMALAPGTPEEAWNRSHVSLLRGDWRTGWAGYEARWAIPGFRAHNHYPPHLPRLRSLEALRPGVRLLVAHEQGAGDSIQMLRYLPRLCDTGARVLWRTSAGLMRLAQAVDPRVEVLSGDAHDDLATSYVVPIMSLPALCETTPATVPRAEGYVRPGWSGRSLEMVREAVRVGICWQGSRDHRNDHNRSLPWPLLHEWVARRLPDPGRSPPIRWVILQRATDLTEPQQRWIARRDGVALGVPEGGDWLDTAAIVRGLDAVITVDTGVAHLAGALGVPTWVLLATPPDWRWGWAGRDTPWYHSVTLVRQPIAGQWGAVLQALDRDFRPLETAS